MGCLGWGVFEELIYKSVSRTKREIELDFEIDKLTNSIENSLTGEIFDTEVTRMLQKEIRQIKKSDWVFDWQKKLMPDCVPE